MTTPYASASLYVGDLSNDVTEALLFELFNPVGPVASIRVCRDAVTRRSLGYAYVNFHNLVDAERALDTMNYTPIKNRACRIMWSHRDPSMRRSGVGNIFIKNLDMSIDHKNLYDTFSAFGNILSCKVMTDDAGRSQGFGFVHYETQEAAEQAITKVNGMLLNGKLVTVCAFVPRKVRAMKGEAKFTNVYVKQIPASVDETALAAFFEVVGPVVNAIIMKDAEGKSKGFGFVNFKNPEDAKKAIEDAKERPIEGDTKVFCCRAQKKNEREQELKKKFEAMKLEKLNSYQGVNLYVKNLDDTVTDDQLRAEFANFGAITSAKVMKDEKMVSKGFGFVCYTTPEDATKAVTEMNGRMLGSKPIYVALAQRKDVRKAQLEAQHQQRSIPNMRPNGGMGMYPGGQPVYYNPGQMPPQGQRPGFGMYPGQNMHVRPRWQPQGGPGGAQPRGGYQAMPYGNVMQGQPNMQGQRGGQRNQGGGNRGGRPNGNQNQNQNQPAPQPAMQQPQGNMMPPPVAANEPLTSNVLVQATPQEQKQILGERLYPLIAKQQPDLAGKITGMLLEMDNSELLILLESPEDLSEKVNEAVTVLEAHKKQMEEQ